MLTVDYCLYRNMDHHHRESRKRLRPWLEKMIVSGECPGLVWENKEERAFRIPWRHFNNKDWVEKDSQVFMEWAKYTGKYHDGDKLDYPVWKTRLRCALKKIPEIKELKEQHHLEDPDPYRVYQFIDVPTMKKVSDVDSDYSASPGSFYTNSPSVRDYLEDSVTPPQKLYETFLAPKCQSNVPTVVYDVPFNYNNFTVKTEESLYHHFANNTVSASNCHADGQRFGTSCYGNFNISTPPNFLCQMPSSSQNFSDMDDIPAGQPELSLLRHETSEAAGGMQVGNDSMKQSLPSDLMSVESADLCALHLQPSSSYDSSDYQFSAAAANVMHITVKYGFPHWDVLQRKVAANGCRLYFGEPQLQHTVMEEEMFGPKSVSQIEMPPVKNLKEICDEQKRFINELLDSMERGLVLTYKDGDIYAQRLCRTRVFVSDGVEESKPLSRKDKTPKKVFDFEAFKAQLEQYHLTKISPMPKHFFYLTFGQQMKKSRSDPLGRIVIHVQVVHTGAAECTSKICLSDASQSFTPLVSSLDPNDKLLQQFKNMSVHK